MDFFPQRQWRTRPQALKPIKREDSKNREEGTEQKGKKTPREKRELDPEMGSGEGRREWVGEIPTSPLPFLLLSPRG